MTLWSISPTLSPGLIFDTSTGEISGTPTNITTSTYTVTAINAGGSGTGEVTITVNDIPPSSISYTQRISNEFYNNACNNKPWWCDYGLDS